MGCATSKGVEPVTTPVQGPAVRRSSPRRTAPAVASYHQSAQKPHPAFSGSPSKRSLVMGGELLRQPSPTTLQVDLRSSRLFDQESSPQPYQHSVGGSTNSVSSIGRLNLSSTTLGSDGLVDVAAVEHIRHVGRPPASAVPVGSTISSTSVTPVTSDLPQSMQHEEFHGSVLGSLRELSESGSSSSRATSQASNGPLHDLIHPTNRVITKPGVEEPEPLSVTTTGAAPGGHVWIDTTVWEVQPSPKSREHDSPLAASSSRTSGSVRFCSTPRNGSKTTTPRDSPAAAASMSDKSAGSVGTTPSNSSSRPKPPALRDTRPSLSSSDRTMSTTGSFRTTTTGGGSYRSLVQMPVLAGGPLNTWEAMLGEEEPHSSYNWFGGSEGGSEAMRRDSWSKTKIELPAGRDFGGRSLSRTSGSARSMDSGSMRSALRSMLSGNSLVEHGGTMLEVAGAAASSADPPDALDARFGGAPASPRRASDPEPDRSSRSFRLPVPRPPDEPSHARSRGVFPNRRYRSGLSAQVGLQPPPQSPSNNSVGLLSMTSRSDSPDME